MYNNVFTKLLILISKNVILPNQSVISLVDYSLKVL